MYLREMPKLSAVTPEYRTSVRPQYEAHWPLHNNMHLLYIFFGVRAIFLERCNEQASSGDVTALVSPSR